LEYLYEETGREAVAGRRIDALVEGFHLLQTHPYAGRARDDDLGAGRRSFVVGPYIIVYTNPGRRRSRPARGAWPPGHCSPERQVATAVSTNLRPTPARNANETALYAPVKAFLEARGYEVKAEVRGCDLVARRGDEPPVIVELKLRFNLPLVLQGIDRLAISERVYLAVPRPPRNRRGLGPDLPAVRRLCRRLGLGLIAVGGDGRVDVVEEPVPYTPRRSKRRAALLLGEFDRRVGDPNIGGRNRAPLVTAYRQDALRCAGALAAGDPMRLRELRARAGVPHADRILQRNVYGWFARHERGVYRLTAAGDAALEQFADALAALGRIEEPA